MSGHGSVTEWLQRVKGGDAGEPVGRLWGLYFTRLVGLARDHLRARSRPARDEEDVALSAFDSFVRAAQAGRFDRLDDREDLWQVLFLLTSRKSADLIEKEMTRKAGGGRGVHLSALRGRAGGSSLEVDFPAPDPDPADAVAMAEGFEQMLGVLADGELQRVAVWRLEGRSNEEMAALLGRSVATVERKLRTVRAIFQDAGMWPTATGAG